MNERSARRRLRAIERELKYYGKKRDFYMESQREAEEKKKKRKRMTKNRRVFLSLLYSALISLAIMFVFTFLMTVEGDIIAAFAICFGYPFVLLFIFIYMILGNTEDTPFSTDLKGVNCVIETLEDEKKRIYSEFPSLENENIEVRFGWTWYSAISYIIVMIMILYLVVYVYSGVGGDISINYPAQMAGFLLLFVLIAIRHLENRSLNNCWIRKELGVDPKRLYK